MAELATAGSIVGLISLSIQACEGLTRYYHDFRSHDQEISSFHQDIEDLKRMCKNLEHQLRRSRRRSEPLDHQLTDLISSSRDGIKRIQCAVERCSSIEKPQSQIARLNQLRLRLVYPLRKGTIQGLNETVHRVQRNIQTALQILQVYGMKSPRFDLPLTVLADHRRILRRSLNHWSRLQPVR